MRRMSVRAGILVTGTEVLSGYVTDRNGPWLSERLAELGVEVEEITVVGDRPEDLEGALGHMRDRGLDLIVTSGGLGPTADDLTAEVVGRFAGRELVLDTEMEEKIAQIIARYRAPAPLRPRGGARGKPQAGDGPGGGNRARPGRHGSRPRRARRRPGRDRPARAAARAAGDVAAGAGGACRAEEVLERAEPYRTMSIRMFGIPESELAKALREIQDDGVDLDELEVTTCLRGGELVTDVRHRPGSEEAAEALRAGPGGAARQIHLHGVGESIE